MFDMESPTPPVPSGPRWVCLGRRPAGFQQSRVMAWLVGAGSMLLTACVPGSPGPSPAPGSFDDRTPRFSPDGQSIVFVRERGEDSDILVIDLSTRRPRVLADASQYDLDPAVSPDGRAVVFDSSPGGYAQLHLVPSGGGPIQPISEILHGWATFPAWAPDGGTIVYSCGRPSYETADLCLISPSGRFRGLLGEASESQEIEPDWSNDGAAVAFASDRAGNADIYLIDVDNERITRLTDESSHDADPAWSPDDRTIAFTSDRSGKVQICLVPSSGGDVRCVVEGIQPSWSPDGRQLTFYRSTSEGTRIFTARVDGSDVVQIS